MIHEEIFRDFHRARLVFRVQFENGKGKQTSFFLPPGFLDAPREEWLARIRKRVQIVFGSVVGKRKLVPVQDEGFNLAPQPSWLRHDLMPIMPFAFAGKATRKKTDGGMHATPEQGGEG